MNAGGFNLELILLIINLVTTIFGFFKMWLEFEKRLTKVETLLDRRFHPSNEHNSNN